MSVVRPKDDALAEDRLPCATYRYYESLCLIRLILTREFSDAKLTVLTVCLSLEVGVCKDVEVNAVARIADIPVMCFLSSRVFALTEPEIV